MLDANNDHVYMSWLYVMDIVHGGIALWIKVTSWRPRADAVNKAFVIDKATCLPHIGLVVSYKYMYSWETLFLSSCPVYMNVHVPIRNSLTLYHL